MPPSSRLHTLVNLPTKAPECAVCAFGAFVVTEGLTFAIAGGTASR